MITTKLKPRLETILLFVILIVLSASSILWTFSDKTPPAWDPSDHLRYAYDYYRSLAHADFSAFTRDFFVARHYYAPFVHLLGALVFLLFGASRLTGLGTNVISLAVLLFSVASMSKDLYARSASEDRKEKNSISLSVLPALIASCYHFSAWLQHDAFLDFPLTAAVTLSFALLIRADDFSDRSAAFKFGIAAGCGMLVKQTFAFFFVLPALYVVVRVLWSRDKRAILNLLLAGVVIAAIAAIWYGPHLQDVIAIYRENRQAAVNENEAPLFTFDSNFFYVHALISMQMQLPLAVLFVVGLIYSLIRCRKQSAILYLWILSGIGMFALVANKDVRYTVPVLPAAAIISACWLREFIPRDRTRRAWDVLRYASVSTIAIWSFVSFFNAQWPKEGWGTAIDTPRYRWMVFSRNYYGFDHRPFKDDWAVPEIVQSLSNTQRTQPVLGVVVNLPYLNPSSVALYSRLLSTKRAGPPLVDVRWVVEPSMFDRLDECDYVLVRTGLDEADWVATAERDAAKLILANPERFTKSASFPIPMKNAEAVIYKQEKH